MAVYTPLNETDLRKHLAEYNIGTLIGYQGIAEGVENSNFFVETTGGRYILTLFEKRIGEKDLPYCLGLMEWLAARNIACPRPVADRAGNAWRLLKNKPSAIVTFVNGHGVAPNAITPLHCHALGALTAYMHLAGNDFPLIRTNTLALSGWQELAAKVGVQADNIVPGLAALIQQELEALSATWPHHLPNGPVHADLFPDNVFFADGALSGVIDFYFACNEAFAYDLAICAAAWCFNTEHHFIGDRLDALMAGYTAIRPLQADEKAAFPILLRGAALRFLLTRTHDQLFHPEGAMVTPKDPLEYLQKLQFFQHMNPA